MKLTKEHKSLSAAGWEDAPEDEAKSGDLTCAGKEPLLGLSVRNFCPACSRAFLFPRRHRKDAVIMKKPLCIVLALALALAVFAGCAAKPADPKTPAESAPPADAEIIITDALGREVKLNGAAQRVVAITAAECEIVCALGAGQTLIGRGAYCDYPAEIFDLPEVSSGYETNVEQIIGLQPDLVIMSSMNQKKEQIDTLTEAGIPCIVTNGFECDFDAVYNSISLIGKALGRDAEAAVLVDGMKESFAAISAKCAGKENKTVYFEVSPLEWGLWTAGTGTFMDEMCGVLGLTNAFADVNDWAEISEEQVLGRDPDYIVTIAMDYGTGESPVDEIVGRPGWQDLSAIKNGNVFNADSDQLSRPGPRLVDAAEMLYEFIYGD